MGILPLITSSWPEHSDPPEGGSIRNMLSWTSDFFQNTSVTYHLLMSPNMPSWPFPQILPMTQTCHVSPDQLPMVGNETDQNHVGEGDRTSDQPSPISPRSKEFLLRMCASTRSLLWICCSRFRRIYSQQQFCFQRSPSPPLAQFCSQCVSPKFDQNA